MTLPKNIFDVDDVRDIITNVKAIMKKELVIMESTVDGDSYRKQFAVPLMDLLIACDEYLQLYGDETELQNDSSTTRLMIVN